MTTFTHDKCEIIIDNHFRLPLKTETGTATRSLDKMVKSEEITLERDEKS